MVPLLQTKTADTAHTGIFASVTRPFPQFWAEPGDEGTIMGGALVFESRSRINLLLITVDCIMTQHKTSCLAAVLVSLCIMFTPAGTKQRKRGSGKQRRRSE